MMRWQSIWVYQVGIDVVDTEQVGEITSRDIPVIEHAFSEKNIKDTKYIEKAIKEFLDQGVAFQYKWIENVPNPIAQQIYKDAGIIIDQVLLGGGSLAFKGMGVGKPVVVSLIEEVEEMFYPDCPLYGVTLDNFTERPRDLINDKVLRIELGARGVAFVNKYIEGRYIR